MNILNVFDWLSNKVEQAFLAGVGRAIAKLDGNAGESDDTGLPAELRIRLVLPAAAVESQGRARRNGKAEASEGKQ